MKKNEGFEALEELVNKGFICELRMEPEVCRVRLGDFRFFAYGEGPTVDEAVDQLLSNWPENLEVYPNGKKSKKIKERKPNET